MLLQAVVCEDTNNGAAEQCRAGGGSDKSENNSGNAITPMPSNTTAPISRRRARVRAKATACAESPVAAAGAAPPWRLK